MRTCTYVNSNPSAFDSDCATCGGKERDFHHKTKAEQASFWASIADKVYGASEPDTNGVNDHLFDPEQNAEQQ